MFSFRSCICSPPFLRRLITPSPAEIRPIFSSKEVHIGRALPSEGSWTRVVPPHDMPGRRTLSRCCSYRSVLELLSGADQPSLVASHAPPLQRFPLQRHQRVPLQRVF